MAPAASFPQKALPALRKARDWEEAGANNGSSMTSIHDSSPGPPDQPGKGGPGYPGPADDLDAKLQAEIEAALGDMSLEDMLDVADLQTKPGGAAGPSMKTGCIVRIHGDDVFVEFGPKSQGVCQLSQFDNPPTVGEVLPFVVDRFDAKDGLLILSRHGAVAKAAWQTMAVVPSCRTYS